MHAAQMDLTSPTCSVFPILLGTAFPGIIPSMGLCLPPPCLIFPGLNSVQKLFPRPA